MLFSTKTRGGLAKRGGHDKAKGGSVLGMGAPTEARKGQDPGRGAQPKTRGDPTKASTKGKPSGK